MLCVIQHLRIVTLTKFFFLTGYAQSAVKAMINFEACETNIR